jgi:TPR repeat protein
MGDAQACSLLGFLYEVGEQVPKDRAQAAHWYEKGCLGGSSDGCQCLARLNDWQVPRVDDVGRRNALFPRLCEDAGAEMCVRLCQAHSLPDDDWARTCARAAVEAELTRTEPRR